MSKRAIGFAFVALIVGAIVAAIMGKDDVATACAFGAVFIWLMS